MVKKLKSKSKVASKEKESKKTKEKEVKSKKKTAEKSSLLNEIVRKPSGKKGIITSITKGIVSISPLNEDGEPGRGRPLMVDKSAITKDSKGRLRVEEDA